MTKERKYTMLGSKDFMDLFSATIKHEYAPTEETKKELERLDAKNISDLNEWQSKAEKEFISEYSQDLFEFIKSISKEYFLVGKSKPFGLSWNISSDENDNYFTVRFYKGKFDYVEDICGGYAGTEILEENISHERVLELLKSTIQ
jgi:hypothetical protein